MRALAAPSSGKKVVRGQIKRDSRAVRRAQIRQHGDKYRPVIVLLSLEVDTLAVVAFSLSAGDSCARNSDTVAKGITKRVSRAKPTRSQNTETARRLGAQERDGTPN